MEVCTRQKSEMDDFTEQLKEAVNRSAPVEDSDFGARETA